MSTTKKNQRFCMSRRILRKSMKKYPFPLFLRKILMSAFLLNYKAN